MIVTYVAEDQMTSSNKTDVMIYQNALKRRRSAIVKKQVMGALHLRRLVGNVACKLGNAYLRYQNHQLATRFP